MSLFVCENPECRAVENTALTMFWAALYDETGETKALCSECSEGVWHGFFEKQTYDPAKHKVQYDGRTWLTDER